MKKLATLVLSVIAAVIVNAKEVEQISIVENESATIKVPFAIKNYAPSNKDVARIESVGGSELRITASRRGRCDLDVMGDNGLHQKYEITVVGDLAAVLETLTMDLDSVPEVRAEIRGNSIRLDGEVSSIAKWEYLMKVLSSYGNVRNFAKFTPGPEILLRLKETLEQAGFAVQFKKFDGAKEKWPAKTVALDLNKKTRVLAVQARLFTEEERITVLSILKNETWLAVNLNDDWKKPVEISPDKAPFVISTLLSLYVDKPIIRLSVAYMAIGEDDITNIGNPDATQGNGVLGIDGVLSALRDVVHVTGDGANSGYRYSGRQRSIGATLDVTARFMKQNGLSRISDTGYTLLESWDAAGAKFKSGGTLFVRVAGADVADLKEVSYGFTINAKGGLVDETTMSCDFDFMISTLLPGVDGADINRKEDSTKQKISLPVGKTTLIGGFKDMVDKNTPPSGLPILRNTPLLNWFVADSGKQVSDRRLVIMVCPEIIDNTQEAKPDVDKEINIRVQDQASKDTDQVVEERKKFHGFWYWLNWFTF